MQINAATVTKGETPASPQGGAAASAPDLASEFLNLIALLLGGEPEVEPALSGDTDVVDSGPSPKAKDGARPTRDRKERVEAIPTAPAPAYIQVPWTPVLTAPSVIEPVRSLSPEASEGQQNVSEQSTGDAAAAGSKLKAVTEQPSTASCAEESIGAGVEPALQSSTEPHRSVQARLVVSPGLQPAVTGHLAFRLQINTPAANTVSAPATSRPEAIPPQRAGSMPAVATTASPNRPIHLETVTPAAADSRGRVDSALPPTTERTASTDQETPRQPGDSDPAPSEELPEKKATGRRPTFASEIMPAPERVEQPATESKAPLSSPAPADDLARAEIPRAVARETNRDLSPAAPPAPAGESKREPIRDIALKVAGKDSNDVSLQISERAGKVQVSVRSSDPELSSALRRNVGDLVTTLEQQGYETKSWTSSRETHAASMAAIESIAGRGETSSAGTSSDDGWQGGQQSGGHPQQEQQHRGNRPKWLADLEDSFGGEESRKEQSN